MCQFIVCELKFTIGESRTISHANDTQAQQVAKMASLATLSFAIDDRGKYREFVEDLMAVKSLSTLSVVINGGNLTYFWGKFVRKCLEECNLLTKLCLTINNYKEEHRNNLREMLVTWVEGPWSSAEKSRLPGNAKCSMTSLADTKHIYLFIYEASNFAAG